MPSEVSFGRRRGACFGGVDVGLRIPVDDLQPSCGGVLVHELAVLLTECLAKADGCVTTEV